MEKCRRRGVKDAAAYSPGMKILASAIPVPAVGFGAV
jgi:hypothetical protein